MKGNHMASVKQGYAEAKGWTVAALKLGTIAIPFGTAFSLGLPELTVEQLVAVGSLVVGSGFGLLWLRKR